MTALNWLTRKAKKQLISSNGDVCSLLFSHGKTQKEARLFLEWLKERGGQASRRQVSQFGYNLQAGKIEEGFTYRRENFYRLVLKRLVNMGFVFLQSVWGIDRHLNYTKVLRYVIVRQSIPQWRGPLGWSFYRLAWEVCKKWNEEYEK